MIKKERKLIITFFTTTDAMAMEHICKMQGIEGRIIPVPPSISAGCGLAWCAKIENESVLREVLEKQGILFQEMQECMV